MSCPTRAVQSLQCIISFASGIQAAGLVSHPQRAPRKRRWRHKSINRNRASAHDSSDVADAKLARTNGGHGAFKLDDDEAAIGTAAEPTLVAALEEATGDAVVDATAAAEADADAEATAGMGIGDDTGACNWGTGGESRCAKAAAGENACAAD
jgi:hypothetical protein